MSEITSINRAASIFNLFINGNAELGPSEVARKLNINKTSAIRLMSALASAQFLNKSNNGRGYVLNAKSLDIAWAYISTVDLTKIAIPYMKELWQKTNESITIHVREEDERICTACLESPHMLRIGPHVGSTSPLHAGSPGTVILAGLPDEEIYKIIERTGLKKYTNYTITDKNKLMEVIQHIRQNGVITSKEEFIDYAVGISAPVKNYTSKIIASLNLHTVMMRFNDDIEKEYTILVKETAEKISRELGCRDNMVILKTGS